MTSDNDLERLALDLVEEAMTAGEDDRKAFIERAAGDTPQLCRRALQILNAGSSETDFLETGGGVADAVSEAAPDEIGGFRIEREIGRGGMGAVYLARRPGADFNHSVAIKVVRSAASERLLARLRFERRTLALLKHPNIAQMYDGGETPEGEPYFIMEYAPGAPLHLYLRDKAPSVETRLDIFQDVCAAVAYAHKNLVIHRDLAPSNILVTEEGHAKLIDFGIAQSLEADERDAHGASLTMTKGYGAPERKEGAPASTATDIYSLGVILREMIEGQPCPRRSDLEAIAKKAAASRPEARYPTVDALMDELKAYREGRGVAAAEKGWAYALTRFAGRRKFAVGAISFAALAVVSSSIIMSVLFLRADAAEKRAQQRFEEVRQMAGFLMFDFHDVVADLEGSTPAREMLVETALAYLDTLKNSPDASKSLRLEIARGYKRLSDVAGNPQVSNLGRLDEAIELLDTAIAEVRSLREEFPEDAEVARAFAGIVSAQAYLDGAAANDFDLALSLNGEALEAIDSVEDEDVRLEDRLAIAELNTWRGHYLYRLESYDDAITQLTKSAALYENLSNEHPENAEARLGLANTFAALGMAIRWKNAVNGEPLDAAAPHFDRAVLESGYLAQQDHATLDQKMKHTTNLLKRANTLCYISGSEERGLEDLDAVQKRSEALLEVDPENSALTENIAYVTLQRIECLFRLERLDDAVEAASDAIARREASLERAPDNPALLRDMANAYSVVSSFYVEIEDWPNACDIARRLDDAWTHYREVQMKRSDFSAGEDAYNQDLLAKCAERGLRAGP